jgi:hypothetical protein
MADDAIKEMISAFAIGCMDKENYTQFRNYVENKGKLPKGELGDLQNIISLIPTILHIEKPSDGLKNELGKRLIQVQKDIKNKIVEDRRETRIDITDEFIKRDESTKVFDVSEKRMGAIQETIVSVPPKQVRSVATTQKADKLTRLDTTPKIVEEKSNLNSLMHWLFSGILLILIVILYFLSSGRISDLEEKNSALETKTTKLRTDIARSNDFLRQNMEFIEFFNNPYIEIIPLKGTNAASKENGRVFLSMGSGEGLLQLNNMPQLEADMTFKLWLVSKSGTFSLGKFEVRPDKKYMPITEIPFVLKEDIEMFTITKENKESTFLTPNGETILFGSIRKETPQTKKRRR